MYNSTNTWEENLAPQGVDPDDATVVLPTSYDPRVHFPSLEEQPPIETNPRSLPIKKTPSRPMNNRAWAKGCHTKFRHNCGCTRKCQPERTVSTQHSPKVKKYLRMQHHRPPACLKGLRERIEDKHRVTNVRRQTKTEVCSAISHLPMLPCPVLPCRVLPCAAQSPMSVHTTCLHLVRGTHALRPQTSSHTKLNSNASFTIADVVSTAFRTPYSATSRHTSRCLLINTTDIVTSCASRDSWPAFQLCKPCTTCAT